MPYRADALKYLAPNWFAIVISLCGLSLAWAQAGRTLGDVAGGVAVVLGVASAAVFAALAVFSWLRWQRHADVVAADWNHPVRYAAFAMVPLSITLLATVAATLMGPNALALALWWLGSVTQLAATVWVLRRWLGAAKGGMHGWAGITPVLFVPVVGNVLAPLAGPALGVPLWATAQFGMGIFLWPILLALVLARLLAHGMWPQRLLPSNFITVVPPSLIGSGLMQIGAPPTLAWMCWGIALLFLCWNCTIAKRLVAQPFSIGFWSLGFPLAAFAGLTLRLVNLSGMPPNLGAMALSLATLVVSLLSLGTYKGLRNASLLEPEPVAQLTVAGKD